MAVDTPTAGIRSYLPRANFLLALVIVLTIVVQVSAIWMVASPLQAVDSPAPVESSENDPAVAIPIAVLLFAELVVVFVLWIIYKRLPEIVRRWLKRGVVVLLAAYALLYATVIMPVLFLAYAAAGIAYWRGYHWVAYDLVALTIAVVIAGTLGGYFGPLPLILLLAFLMVYDWIGVVETSVMSRLVRLLSDIKLPAMVVIPKRTDFDIWAYLETLAEHGVDSGNDVRDQAHLAIGAGDFALPAALTASAFRYYGPEVAAAAMFGTVAGLVLLMGARDEDALPGLPWLGGGAIIGVTLPLLFFVLV